MLLFICFLISPTILTARPLMVEPELNLALPGALMEKISSDSDSAVDKKQNVPCEMSSANDLKRFGAGNYGSLFLSALPKGMTVPPSGPSGRTNAVNN
ncbi:hypothetical protein Ccrd_011601 [Cynara cardunculus var. scolymus]|uniref:Uncharacterized protein n=2 Tax=Cynara cardunculus var. scolymus TaxID=59895 RepID=A0A124SHM6_CYNCS|nr:hypothetical protein Ccrd_011601 [Cynara cardunculus var. scolymus]